MTIESPLQAPADGAVFCVDPDHITADTPKSLWIELTSQCPFDCIFCSRKAVRGLGEHMDFQLFRSILSQLRNPEIIRLNYSGESIHYPQIAEAIRLSKATGAVTELVTAFASISSPAIASLVESGLDRLSISLHTLDSLQFKRIYRFGSLENLLARIEELCSYKVLLKTALPALDFAFVAIDENLSQLVEIVGLAERLGIPEVFVHPVIRREASLRPFPAELDSDNRLRPEFARKIAHQVTRARQQHPGVSVNIARPGVDLNDGTATPRAPAPGMVTCEQNPWDTVHVLSNGDVVVCEVQDKTVMGNLTTQSLREVWLGESYRRFRQWFLQGAVTACGDCPWRKTVPFAEWTPSLTAHDRNSAQFVRGWHTACQESVLWSRRGSSLVLLRPPGRGYLKVQGILPPAASPARPNALTVRADGLKIGKVRHAAEETRSFDLIAALPRTRSNAVTVSFEVNETYCPSRAGTEPDIRELGFALMSASCCSSARSRLWPGGGPIGLTAATHALRCGTLHLVFAVLALLDRTARLAKPRLRLRCLPEPLAQFRPGCSVIIPERGNVSLLRECLSSLSVAVARVREPVQVIVIVNGSGREDYFLLQHLYPHVAFRFFAAPLSFSAAVERGLRDVAYDWVYLLNNDVVVEGDTLSEVLRYRANGVFSVASQIFLQDMSRGRVETNWTDLAVREGLVELLEVEPDGTNGPHGSLYAGGGCSLFQTRLLRAAVKACSGYDPAYWEDVEWGVLARRHGYINLFCPSSCVRHRYRATVEKYYEPEEIDRIFQRNRILFQLRNLTETGCLSSLKNVMRSADQKTLRELLAPSRLPRILRARWRSAFLPHPESALFGTRQPYTVPQCESRSRPGGKVYTMG